MSPPNEIPIRRTSSSSEASAAALAYGREFARTFGARLHVVHVVENSMMLAGPEGAGVNFARLQAELETTAQNTLNRIVTQEDREQLGAATVVRTGGSEPKRPRYTSFIAA